MRVDQAIRVIDEIVGAVRLNRIERQKIDEAWQTILTAATEKKKKKKEKGD